VPGIQVFGAPNEGVDARDEFAHDDLELFDPPREVGFMGENFSAPSEANF
jgi:hypothetical protein